MQKENRRTVAIVGAGFSGMAVAWNLLQSSYSITIFDAVGVGGGASGVAAGLMHPYSGLHAKLNWMGLEGYNATQRLLKVAEQTLGHPVSQQNGLLRIAITEGQKKDYLKCSESNSDVIAFSSIQCSQLAPSIVPHEGILIPSGITVNSSLYLEGLWKACSKKGVKLIKEKIEGLGRLQDFDAIVIATGASSQLFPELKEFPLAAVKGQVIELFWPETLEPLSIPINSQAYILMNATAKSCVLGATFERDFVDPFPHLDIARAELFPKIEPLLPQIRDWSIKECRSGLRSSTPDHRPIAKMFKKNFWVLAGMGSKGLLYHALFAEELCRQIKDYFRDDKDSRDIRDNKD